MTVTVNREIPAHRVCDKSSGTVQGRTRWNDAASDWFAGDIDVVHVYQGALSVDDIQYLAGL
jgi:hypothetical protein